jgi:shikimate kinase
MKLVLLGFMGAGKTTVAKELGRSLSLPVIEIDEEIVQQSERRSVPEIFHHDGEDHFRRLEYKVIHEYRDRKNCIISPGGGVIEYPNTMTALRESNARLIFLDATFEVLHRRVLGDANRPLFQSLEKAKSLYEKRRPLYLQASNIVIDTSTVPVDEVVRRLIERISSDS